MPVSSVLGGEAAEGQGAVGGPPAPEEGRLQTSADLAPFENRVVAGRQTDLGCQVDLIADAVQGFPLAKRGVYVFDFASPSSLPAGR